MCVAETGSEIWGLAGVLAPFYSGNCIARAGVVLISGPRNGFVAARSKSFRRGYTGYLPSI